MRAFEPRDPDYEPRVRGQFAAQPFMETLGAELTALAPGAAEIRLPHRTAFQQHSGVFHAGATTSIADTAAGFAAATLFDAGSHPLTVELKINLLAPARGEALIARGRVVRPGRTITTTAADVFAAREGGETLVATMLATMIRMTEGA